MPKISALKGITKKHRNPYEAQKKLVKREHAWMDVSDDDMHVKGSKQTLRAPFKNIDGSPHPNRRDPLKSANIRPGSAGYKSEDAKGRKLTKLRLIEEQRKQLPIALGKDALVEEIRRNDVTILVGETGSGKTTQVPQYLLESGLAGQGIIAVTQPRKVAATSLASRVATEQNVSVGSLVGYSVRFQEASSKDTRIKYATDGMLVRELLGDPLLSQYSVIVVDEAHERTLRTDLLIANLKTIQKARNAPSDEKGKKPASQLNPLRIVIMSATLDAEKFSKFFDGARVVYVKGRQHPVTIYHTAVGQADYVDAALRTFWQIHLDQPNGDVLIFLPGQEDIESLEKSLKMYASRLPKDTQSVVICPMYAALPPTQQAKIFTPAPADSRKCILATNIAETSITIPGVKYVIDTGKCKEKRYVARDIGTGFDALLTKDITQSSAMQRAGRAGREGPGFCFRLYTDEAFSAMPMSTEPEIRRCTLTASLLQLKCIGQNLEEINFMDRPDEENIAAALKSLYLLGALDNTRRLTKLGRQMAHFPLEPNLARIVIASTEYGCTLEVLNIVSVLSSSSKLFFDTTDERDAAAEARRKFRSPSGDHLSILNVVNSYQEISRSESNAGRRDWCRKHFLNHRCLVEASDIRDQLRQVCERLQIDWKTSCGSNEQSVLRSLVSGLVQHGAFIQPDGSYKQLMGPSVLRIHPSSSLADKKVPAIIFDELVYTSHIFARGVSAVPRSYIAEVPVLNRREA